VPPLLLLLLLGAVSEIDRSCAKEGRMGGSSRASGPFCTSTAVLTLSPTAGCSASSPGDAAAGLLLVDAVSCSLSGATSTSTSSSSSTAGVLNFFLQRVAMSAAVMTHHCGGGGAQPESSLDVLPAARGLSSPTASSSSSLWTTATHKRKREDMTSLPQQCGEVEEEQNSSSSSSTCSTGQSCQKSAAWRTARVQQASSSSPSRDRVAPHADMVARNISSCSPSDTDTTPTSGGTSGTCDKSSAAGTSDVTSSTTSTASGGLLDAATLQELASCSTGVSPEDHLLSILKERGYAGWVVESSDARKLVAQPSQRQIDQYDMEVGLAIRSGDLATLERLVKEEGRQMDACNKFGESLIHLACRRGAPELLRFLLAHGGSLSACDDLGRSPLHDLCWCPHPRWELVKVFLERDEARLFITADKRGWTPLKYVRRAHWPVWRAFFDSVKDIYWPPAKLNTATSSDCTGTESS
jgi:hypothetical protein